MITAPGTSCLAEAEDAVAAALQESVAWQDICEAANEVEAERKIHFDLLPLPDDGYAFTLDELADLRVAALVFTDPEAGFGVEQGDAQDHQREGGRVLVVIERWVRESEAASGINPQRWLNDRLANAASEIHQKLTDTKGQRWMRRTTLRQPAVAWEEKHKLTKGLRQQACIVVEWGNAAGASN